MVETKAQIIDGKATAAAIKEELKAKTSKLEGRVPGLAVILVGDDPASHYYVGSKQKSCTEVGMESFKTVLPADASQEDVKAVIETYNQDPKVDAILLQLPLPDAIRNQTQEIVDTISPSKDVDGLTTTNLGRLMTGSSDAISPCTPKGCMELLKRYEITAEGKKAIVLGRSLLVGKSISLMLNQANATVTMAHSRTQNLEQEVKAADIVVAAIGRTEFVKAEWIKEGAVILDVGINAENIQDENGETKRKLFGDVEFEGAAVKASAITPVPGGVGPMTVAMLLQNTLELFENS